MIEAQAMGKPVIASDHGGARETILEGKTGWLFPAGNSDALAEILNLVLNLPESLSHSFRERAMAHIKNNFSKTSMCDKTLNVYSEVLADRNSD